MTTKKKPDEFPTAKELFDETAPAEEATPDFETGFIILVTHDGDIATTNDLNAKFTVSRQASVKDMRRSASELLAEIALNSTAAQATNNLVAVLQQQAQLAADNETNAKIQAKLASRGIQIAGR